MIHESWSIVAVDQKLCDEFAAQAGCHPITARVLVGRGIADVEEAREYLAPSLADLPDPFLLPDMEIAVERIIRALKEGERIALVGDYDVDGVASAALMARFFRSLGVLLDVHIPHRIDEGYGVSIEALEMLKTRGAGLVITVDNGTRGIDEIEVASGWGLDVIVTDHHEPGETLPAACAVVNPKRRDSAYPCGYLAGCGVAFALLMALRKRLRERGMLHEKEPNLLDLMDLVALGTVADIVPLTGANRILVKHGLDKMSVNPMPGIRALLEVSGIAPHDAVRAEHVAFRLGPRLNAAGRLGDPYPAFECLATDDGQRAHVLAQELHRLNVQRQGIEERMLAQLADELTQAEGRPAVVISSPSFHPGIVGIVASRIARMTGKPCAVIAEEKTMGRGSVRTARGIDIMKALAEASPHLVRFGGHAEAAGFAIETDRIGVFRDAFERACADTPLQASPALVIDAQIEARHIDDRLVKELAALEPYGIGNPEPLFIARDLAVVDSTVVGGAHLKMKLTDGRSYFSAIGFGMARHAPMLDRSSVVAFMPQFNTWNGMTSIQLKVSSILKN